MKTKYNDFLMIDKSLKILLKYNFALQNKVNVYQKNQFLFVNFVFLYLEFYDFQLIFFKFKYITKKI